MSKRSAFDSANSTAAAPVPRDEEPRTPRWLRTLIPAVLAIAWLVLSAAGGPSFGKISGVASNDQVQQLPANAEATMVQELQSGFRDADLIPAILVYERDGGLTDADQALIGDQIQELDDLPGVSAEGVSPMILSEDGAAAEVFIPIDSTIKVSDTVELIRASLSERASDGLSAYITGPAGLTADIVQAFSGIDGLLLLVAFSAVFVILVVVYRSPLLPLIVLGTGLFALTGAVLTVVALASADIVTLTGQTQGILFILVIGAATDYSLLYVARYREALRDHDRRWTATVTALRGSWEPILASGATVIAALLILLLSDLNSNKTMGPVASIGIVFALLAALTFLPAVMMFAGRVAFWPVRPKFGSAHPVLTGVTAKGVWPRLGRGVSRRPRLIWIGTTMVLLLATVGLFWLKADGVSQSEFVLGQSEARDGQAVLGEHFPGGSGTPAVIIGPEASVPAMARIILDTEGVASLSIVSSDSPSGSIPLNRDGVSEMQESGSSAPEGAGPATGESGGSPAFRTPPGEATVVDGRVLLQATLDAPGDSAAAEATVWDLREQLAGVDGEVLVGGLTAVALDSNDAAIHDRNLIIPLVLVVITLILMLLLRAVVAPILLILSVVVSFGAALGVSALVFNGIFDFPGADPSVPLFGFVFLVALGIDYNIFLMTRVREESQQYGTREGVLRGLASTGGVITSAGLVLAATFAALGVLPILFLVQISFIVAFGVLVDTFIVRSLLVPALSYDLGRAIWWPSRLAKAAHENGQSHGSLAH